MVELKKSRAYRLSSENGRQVAVGFSNQPDHWTRENYMFLRFDIGSEKKHEPISVRCSPADFKEIAAAMMKADKARALKAFATAILDD